MPVLIAERCPLSTVHWIARLVPGWYVAALTLTSV